MSKVDSEQALTLMKKHIRLVETIIDYDSDNDTDICGLGTVMYPSNIRPAILVDDRAHLPSRGNFTVYQEQLKAGLRFLLYPLTMMLTIMMEAAIKMKMAPQGDKIVEEGKCKCYKVIVSKEKELLRNSVLNL
ncbi:hypothetical protein M9H77_06328 [Catharanthus roseus]|uniref:Uncharacterized protein n=1 Tax=Catharanthus roseus TaxID=4058 RepID=A0ACC0BRZ6_CATRO|nr:hypothetical protein M9H77_06328 [Catharanthus roseus]